MFRLTFPLSSSRIRKIVAICENCADVRACVSMCARAYAQEIHVLKIGNLFSFYVQNFTIIIQMWRIKAGIPERYTVYN